MKYPASEKLGIINLVERSSRLAKRTLDKLGVTRRTFYRWLASQKHRSQQEYFLLVAPSDLRLLLSFIEPSRHPLHFHGAHKH